MCSSIALIGCRWCAKSSSASNAEVLADLIVLLWVQVRFRQDVDATFSGPVPVNHLATHVGYVAKVKDVVFLGIPGFLRWAWM